MLYLHGGAYVFEIVKEHWALCALLVEELGITVTVPLYPLAPEHGVEDALRVATAAYRSMLTLALGVEDAPRVAVMGDSAGAGLALALAQNVALTALTPPRDIVLLSPWLDAVLDNPAIPAVERIDPWLARPGLLEAARLYAGAHGLRDPRVSPLRGPLADLGAITIFIGTRDLFLPDAERLVERARAAGTNAALHTYPGMVHDFMLIARLPEAKRAVAAILNLLR